MINCVDPLWGEAKNSSVPAELGYSFRHTHECKYLLGLTALIPCGGEAKNSSAPAKQGFILSPVQIKASFV